MTSLSPNGNLLQPLLTYKKNVVTKVIRIVGQKIWHFFIYEVKAPLQYARSDVLQHAGYLLKV